MGSVCLVCICIFRRIPFISYIFRAPWGTPACWPRRTPQTPDSSPPQTAPDQIHSFPTPLVFYYSPYPTQIPLTDRPTHPGQSHIDAETVVYNSKGQPPKANKARTRMM